jgi:hypothetical protein
MFGWDKDKEMAEANAWPDAQQAIAKAKRGIIDESTLTTTLLDVPDEVILASLATVGLDAEQWQNGGVSDEASGARRLAGQDRRQPAVVPGRPDGAAVTASACR